MSGRLWISLKRSKQRPWKNRKPLSELTMPDGYKITFWLYEWNETVSQKLGHRFCIRILKTNPQGRFLFTEQIGIRHENWEEFVKAINALPPINSATGQSSIISYP
jgi:hypothetical protein